MVTEKEILNKYRSEIDAIDDKILDLLSERVEVVKNVGSLKNLADTKQSIIRPGREAKMIRRVAEKSSSSLSKAAIAQMWRMIISSAINVEENARISTLSFPNDNRDCYWLAREYFGSFTPMIQRPTAMEVIRDIINQKATVGVLPLWDEEEQHSWWSRLLETENYPKVFAKVPFIQHAPSQKTPLAAIGYVTPEPTGDDGSLWVIKAEEKIPFPALQTLLDDAKINYVLQESCRDLNSSPTMNHFLLEMPEFINEDDDRIANFIDLANSSNREWHDKQATNITAHYIGSYATPILLT